MGTANKETAGGRFLIWLDRVANSNNYLGANVLAYYVVRHTPICLLFLYSNPHPPQMVRVWVENNYLLKKWGG
jgi:hypothetical protein